MLLCSGVPPVPSLRAVGARFWVGVPPPILPLGGRSRLARATVWGGGSPPSLFCRAPAPSARAWVFRPPPPPKSVPRCGPWLHGRPLLMRAPCWPDLFLTPLTPVSCTRGAQARRAWTWRRWRHRSTLAGALRRRLLPPSPSPRPAPPSCRFMPCRLRRRALAPWLLGRWVGFRPLPPAPVRPHPVGIGTL